MYKSLLLTILVLLSYVAFSANYASMELHDASTDIVSGTLTGGNEVQITGYSSMEVSNWTFSSDQLTASASAVGEYNLKYSLSFTGSVATWTIVVKKNGTAVSKITGKRKIGLSTDIGNVSGTCLVSIADGDIITIYASPDVDATELTPIHSQVVLSPIASSVSPKVGEMYLNDNSIAQTLGTGWEELDGFASGNLNALTYSSNTLEIPSDGGDYYMVVFSSSFRGNGPNDYSFGLSVNDGNPTTMQMKRNISGNADRGNALFCGIVSLSNSDDITIKVKSSAVSQDIIVVHGNLSVYSLDGSTASDYGEMYMSNNATALTMAGSDVWTDETNFSTGSTSEWTHSSGDLTVGSSGKGDYFVSFSAAVTYEDVDQSAGTYVYVDVGIFVNDVLQENLVYERKLQKKDNEDYGSIAGAGFLSLYQNDEVSIKFKEVDGKGMKTIDANLNLIQISTQNVLPVELIYFNAKQDDKTVLLDWQTASEINNNYFTIERSSDIKTWESIYSVVGAGNANYISNYNIIDEKPIIGQSYYRLKQTDFDDKFSHSEIIAVNYKENEPTIQINYNSQTKQLVVQSLSNELSDVYIYSSAGTLINIDMQEGLSDANQKTVDLNKLSAGVYIVKVSHFAKQFVVL